MCAVAVSGGDHIVSMSLSPSEETLVCTTASKQLLIHTLSTSDLTKVYSAVSNTIILEQFLDHRALILKAVDTGVYDLLFELYLFILQGLSASAFDYLTCSFHHRSVTGMDVCPRKPIIATCSLDQTIRVWNYENKSVHTPLSLSLSVSLSVCLSLSLSPHTHYCINHAVD